MLGLELAARTWTRRLKPLERERLLLSSSGSRLIENRLGCYGLHGLTAGAAPYSGEVPGRANRPIPSHLEPTCTLRPFSAAVKPPSRRLSEITILPPPLRNVEASSRSCLGNSPLFIPDFYLSSGGDDGEPGGPIE